MLVDLYEQAVLEHVAGREQILTLTFSTGAADEIARRIDERLKDDFGEAWISTFHSFCWRVLRDHAPDPRRMLVNSLQEAIVMRQVLSEIDSGVVVVVGDPDQSIYGFRGTVPRLLGLDFPNVYGAATVSLEECWRCSQEVIDAGERLLDATQPGRARTALRSVAQLASPSVVLVHEGDAIDEAFMCAREIKRIHAAFPELRHDDFAILLRSTTALGAPFEEALRALDLPYEVRGSGATARNEVVRFLVGYLESLRKPDDPH